MMKLQGRRRERRICCYRAQQVQMFHFKSVSVVFLINEELEINVRNAGRFRVRPLTRRHLRHAWRETTGRCLHLLH